MTELTIDRLHKSFGSVEVLTDINLHVKTGEFTVFVGPSGCGKSTLLRMVCGLDEVTAGSVVIDNEVVNDVPPSKRGIAMVFQTYALYPHMSVAQNMGYALKLAGADKDEIARRVQRAAEILKIEDYLDRKPRQLSGGQRQRVAIGRAIVREPKIFLFDEPLSNLDAALRVDMRMEFARLKDRLGTTMIYVTHDQVEAMTLADKIVVMSAGRIEQVGSPLELYNAPRNRFVAGFIGSPKMNFLPILGHNGGQLHLPGGAMTLPQGIKAETVYSVGIRPEHVQLTESATNRMTGALMTAEHLGSDTFVYAEIDGVERPILARLGGERPVTSGETVTLGFETDDVHFFDKDGLSLRPSAMADAA